MTDVIPLDDGCRLVPHVRKAPAKAKPNVSLVPRPTSHLHILFQRDVPAGYDRRCDPPLPVFEKFSLIEVPADDEPPVAPSAFVALAAAEPVDTDDALGAGGSYTPPSVPNMVGGYVAVPLTPPLPEPSTWALLATGIYLVLRRINPASLQSPQRSHGSTAT